MKLICHSLIAVFYLTVGLKPSEGRTPSYNYGEVLRLSLFFYEAQRSGKLPSTNRIAYRRDSMLTDVGENGEDLTGGYFDADVHFKLGFPTAYVATLLAWSLYQHRDGYKKAGEYENGLLALEWATDYFIKAHTAGNEFYCFISGAEDRLWMRPEDMSAPRIAFKLNMTKPGSDVTGETAAALAAASLAFRNADPSYANALLEHAMSLYDFANSARGRYSDSVSVYDFYRSTDYIDELVWAASWLYLATDKRSYLDYALNNYLEFNLANDKSPFSWDSKTAGVNVLLARITGNETFRSNLQAHCDSMINQGQRTPKGLLLVPARNYGVLGRAADTAFICQHAADLGLNTEAYQRFAEQQLGYTLGDTDRSFVVGYGVNSPQRPCHRASSCPPYPTPCNTEAQSNTGANYHVLYGALVDGPNQRDEYEDVRGTKFNGVNLHHNAGFTALLARLNSD